MKCFPSTRVHTSPTKFQNAFFFGKNEYSEIFRDLRKAFPKSAILGGQFIMFSVDERL